MIKKEMSFITVQLEKDLKERFEEKVELEYRTVSATIRLLIEEYIKEQ